MSDEFDKAPEPPHKRRWFQYSIRSLMLMTLLISCWLGYISHNARKQKAAVAWVKKNEGDVKYDYQLDEDGFEIPNVELPGFDWLREWIGIDYFCHVNAVSLDGTQVTDLSPLEGLTNLDYLNLPNTQVNDFSPLAGLKNLKILYLSGTQVTDISPLEGLTNLEELYLPNTQVNDLSPLKGLKKLKWLSLGNTPVSKQEVQNLQKTLPNCEIEWGGK